MHKLRGQRGKGKPTAAQDSIRQAASHTFGHMPSLFQNAADLVVGSMVRAGGRSARGGDCFVRVTTIVQLVNQPILPSDDPSLQTFIFTSKDGSDSPFEEAIKCSYQAHQHLSKCKKKNQACACRGSFTIMTSPEEISAAFPPSKRVRRDKNPDPVEHAESLFLGSSSRG